MRSDFGGVMADVARLGLLGEKAAVDDQFGAGDKRGFVGGEDSTPMSATTTLAPSAAKSHDRGAGADE
jgi:hypothetical protein